MNILNYIEKIKRENEGPRITAQEPRNMAQGGRIGLSDGQLVRNTADGSRPGYQGKKGMHDTITNQYGTFKLQKDIKYDYAKLEKNLPKGVNLNKDVNRFIVQVRNKKGKLTSKSYSATLANKKKAIDFVTDFYDQEFPNRLTDEKFKKLRLKNKEMTVREFEEFLKSEKITGNRGGNISSSKISRLDNELLPDEKFGTRTFRTVDEAKAIIKARYGPSYLKLLKTDGEILLKATSILQAGKTSFSVNFPRGVTKESIMWYNFNRAARGGSEQITYDLSKIGDKLPLDKNGKVDWTKKINGKAAWKQVRFIDNDAGKTFSWTGKEGDLKNQINKGYNNPNKFQNTMRAFDEQGKISNVFKGAVRDRLLKQELEAKLERKLTSADDDLLKKWYKTKRPGFSLSSVHHPEGVAKNVYNTQNVFTAANLKERDLQNIYRKEVRTLGETKAKANLRKGMINLSDEMGGITAKVGSQYAGTKPTITSVAKQVKEASGLKWNQAIKTSKAQTLAKTLELAGIKVCSSQLAKAGGGRIGFAEPVCGMEYAKQNEDAFMKQAAKSEKAADLFKSGNMAKHLMKAKNWAKSNMGPAGWIGGELLIMGLGSVWDMSQGKGWKEALDNWTGLGGHSGQAEKRLREIGMEQGYSEEQINEAMKIGQLMDLSTEVEGKQWELDQIQEQQDIGGTARGKYDPNLVGAYKPTQGQYQDPKKIRELKTETPKLWEKGTELYESLKDYDFSVGAYDEMQQKKKKEEYDRMMELRSKPMMPGYGQQFQVSGKPEFKPVTYAGGGMVGIRRPSALPPTGGPMSQGLRSLYNNVKKS